MRKRKKNEEEHENLERWLVSYADFITLLFAFFVVMYGISSVDVLKLQKLASAVQFAFSFHGKGGSDRVPLFPGPSQKSLSVTGPVLQDPSGDNADRDELQIIQSQLSGALKQSTKELTGAHQGQGGKGTGDLFQIKLDHRGLVISLAAKYLFLPGQAEVRPELLPVIDTIALSLKATNRFIRVEGHTDNLPPGSGRYASNWELSVARATFVVRYMVQRWELPPFLLCVSGYAEFRPVASNATENGRASNRRVDILVLSHKENRLEPPPYLVQAPDGPGYHLGDRAFLEDFLSRQVP